MCRLRSSPLQSDPGTLVCVLLPCAHLSVIPSKASCGVACFIFYLERSRRTQGQGGTVASCELWFHHWQGKQVTGRAEWMGINERRSFCWFLIHGLARSVCPRGTRKSSTRSKTGGLLASSDLLNCPQIQQMSWDGAGW